MTDFERLLTALVSGGVEFIIIGGMAATAHGSAHVTVDLDIVYRRTRPELHAGDVSRRSRCHGRSNRWRYIRSAAAPLELSAAPET